jgi:hypothetical protein
LTRHFPIPFALCFFAGVSLMRAGAFALHRSCVVPIIISKFIFRKPAERDQYVGGYFGNAARRL